MIMSDPLVALTAKCHEHACLAQVLSCILAHGTLASSSFLPILFLCVCVHMRPGTQYLRAVLTVYEIVKLVFALFFFAPVVI